MSPPPKKENKDKLLRRLRRIEGQAGAIVRMAENDAYCIDLLTQIAAARAALLAAGKIILRNHLQSCVVESFKGGNSKRAIEEIETVLEIDPKHTGALDARAMLYYELPGLLGGNLNKSIESLEKGIALDSNYTLLYVDMAKVYIKKKDYDKARWYLNRALEISTPTYEADHVLDDRPEALELLEEIKDR